MRLFVDNLTNIDFSFLHPVRGLVGETWLASVELVGELDTQGMVVDFGVVKRMIRQWLDDQIDHRLLIPGSSAHLKFETDSSRTKFTWRHQDSVIQSECPSDAVTVIDNADVITTDSVATWCIQELSPKFPKTVKELRLTFTTESIDGPYYHYSHGLKKHDGNCQRIAHGHRSRILIWRNSEISYNDMNFWAKKWQDIYIGTREDLVASPNAENVAFRYDAQQGEFYLEIDKHQCYLIETDSTIEFIAQHIAQELKKQSPNDSFKVKAFEGLSKGAIAEI